MIPSLAKTLRIKLILSITVGSLLIFSCSPAANNHSNSSESKSITPQGAVVGKWLVSVGIGLGVPAGPTLMLRDTLAPILKSEQGGGYKHLVDISDVEGSTIPTKRNIQAELGKVADDIQNFRKDHPDSPTMAIILLTGHGTTENNIYTYSVVPPAEDAEDTSASESSFTGEEIVDVIEGWGVDETVIIVQSCQSGSLAKGHFAPRFSQQLSKAANKKNIHISVITPVSQYVNSPLETWEEILAKSIKESTFSGNWITYQDFKDRIMYHSCKHPAYVPYLVDPDRPNVTLSSFELVGLDPQFYEHISPNLPMFLTPKGVTEWANAGDPALPILADAVDEVAITPETLEICNKKKKDLAKYYFATKEDIKAILVDENISLDIKQRYHDSINYRKFPYGDRVELSNIKYRE
jgi:hypothetical protein